MRTNNLDTEEREILESYERGEWQSIGTLQERQKYQAYAVAAVGIKGQISISLPIEDLRVVQLNLEIRVTNPVDYVRQEEN
jgi:predicted DNA binding CopG/RHH family protein